MSCKHYDHGQCRAKAHEVPRISWIGFIAIQRTHVEYSACDYSNDVWVGSMCVPGAVGLGPAKQQSECALYAADRTDAPALAQSGGRQQ